MDAFFDTNVLVYAFSHDKRAERALELLAGGGTVAVQSLGEFASVALGKLGFDWRQTREALAAVEAFCKVAAPAGLVTHRHGLDLAQRYRLGVFDAMLVASALEEGCRIFWSEDMQHGQLIENQLTIRNPFKSQA